jgi:hypothetical protein
MDDVRTEPGESVHEVLDRRRWSSIKGDQVAMKGSLDGGPYARLFPANSQLTIAGSTEK